MKNKFLSFLFVVLLCGCKPAPKIATATPTATAKPTVKATNEPWPWPTYTPVPKVSPTYFATPIPLPTDIPARLDFSLPDEAFFYENKPDRLNFCFPNYTVDSVKEFYEQNLGDFDWKPIGFGCRSDTIFYPSSYAFLSSWEKFDRSEQVDLFIFHSDESDRTCILAIFSPCH